MSRTSLSLLLLAISCFAQEVQPPPAGRGSGGFTISANVDLVILDASVKDANGGYVSHLTKDDFQVYEDNKRQTIQSFSSADIPVTIGLVIDNSGSMAPKRTEVVTAALSLIKGSNPHDEIFVVHFNDKVRFGLPPGMPFTDDIQTLRAALMNGRAEGRTSLYDALAESLRHLNEGHMDKKTLVLVSDGGDNASKLPWNELLAEVEKSRATIYTIDIFDESDPDHQSGVLKKLAQVSGGDYFRVNELPEIEAVCEKIGVDIRNRYTIAYRPSHQEPGPPVHTIKVTASTAAHQRLTVRTRSRYIAPGPDRRGVSQ